MVVVAKALLCVFALFHHSRSKIFMNSYVLAVVGV